jgi:uncharacterized protein (DUF697 family)
MSDKSPKKESLMNSFQELISDKLMDLFDLVIMERKAFHEHDKKVKAGPEEIKKIISNYSNTNAAISGGLSLIPGVAGMATVLPEIALVVRNQLQMIYDIGAANGKEKSINKELMAGILVTYFGSKGIEMLTVQGGTVLLKQTSVKFFEHIVSLLSFEISEQIIQSAIVKWVPLAGSVAMAVWSRYTTMRIGKHAANIFSKNIEQSKETATETELSAPKELKAADFEAAKIKALINLMGLDLAHDQREISFIEQIIQHSSLELDDQLILAKKLHEKVEIKNDLSIFKNNPTAMTGLIVDLLALAKTDESAQLAEMLYLKKIAVEIGLTKEELEELMG